MYLPAYDALSTTMHSLGAGHFSPLLAGSAARTAAVLLTSPFELVKTRLQTSGNVASEANFSSVWKSLALREQVSDCTEGKRFCTRQTPIFAPRSSCVKQITCVMSPLMISGSDDIWHHVSRPVHELFHRHVRIWGSLEVVVSSRIFCHFKSEIC